MGRVSSSECLSFLCWHILDKICHFFGWILQETPCPLRHSQSWRWHVLQNNYFDMFFESVVLSIKYFQKRNWAFFFVLEIIKSWYYLKNKYDIVKISSLDHMSRLAILLENLKNKYKMTWQESPYERGWG